MEGGASGDEHREDGQERAWNRKQEAEKKRDEEKKGTPKIMLGLSEAALV